MQLKEHPKVSIVILNWNGWKDTLECLESLFLIGYPNYQIIIVDNGSEDQSIERIWDYANGKLKIKSSFISCTSPPQHHKMVEFTLKEIDDNASKRNLDCNIRIILIKSDENFGFAEGNNIGIRFALNYLGPDYVLLLNNDTFVEEKFLENLVEVAETDKKIGIVGPKVCYYHNPTIINSAGVLMNWHAGIGTNLGIGDIDNGQFDKTLDLDALIGVCLLIRASLFKEVGYLDKKFFLLLEETDFCIRARINNFKVIFHPKSKVYHKEGFSGKLNPSSLYLTSRNRLFLIRKHQTVDKILIYTGFICLRAILDSVFYLVKGDLNSSKAIITGTLHGLRN
jgi:GT2 family glycosyltransferase